MSLEVQGGVQNGTRTKWDKYSGFSGELRNSRAWISRCDGAQRIGQIGADCGAEATLVEVPIAQKCEISGLDEHPKLGQQKTAGCVDKHHRSPRVFNNAKTP